MSDVRLIKERQFGKKLAKLKRQPVAFVRDSSLYSKAEQAWYKTYAKFGSFSVVVLTSLLVVGYYTLWASDRFVSQTQFVVKQADSNEMPVVGLAALGTASTSMKDSMIVKAYIESMDMAQALDEAVGLKRHYQNTQWDMVSRLSSSASKEDYLKYYQEHVVVVHDELSDILTVEVQTYDAEYSEKVASELLGIAEDFINRLGSKVADSQVLYAEEDVTRNHLRLKETQNKMITFQDSHEVFNAEKQGNAAFSLLSELEAQLVKEEAELKALLSYMRSNAPEVKAKKIKIDAIKSQLDEEKVKLLSETGKESINQVAADYQELKLNAELASGLYTASLSSLESVKADAYRKLKHLLLIEAPSVADDGKYPRRVYSIITWFVVLTLIYLLARLGVAIVNEHRD